jgi:hypothetical protein
MRTQIGVALIGAGGLVAFSLVTWLRDRFRPAIADALAAASGIAVGCGGLVVVGGGNIWSWVLAPLVLAIGAVAQRKALLAPGGPFRT